MTKKQPSAFDRDRHRAPEQEAADTEAPATWLREPPRGCVLSKDVPVLLKVPADPHHPQESLSLRVIAGGVSGLVHLYFVTMLESDAFLVSSL